MIEVTEEIINAIGAGISSDDNAIEQALEIIENLERAGYVIVRTTGKPLDMLGDAP